MPTFLSEPSPLERYGHNLTALAQQGAFVPLTGEDAAVQRVFQILLRNTKCNPMILDGDETRRRAVVAEVVCRMARGDAPDPLPQKHIIALDYEALFANLTDDTLIRQERRKQMRAPLQEDLASIKIESDEEWWARMENVPLWPPLEEWLAPTMVLERLQAIFIALHQAVGSFLLFVDHFHCLVGGEEKYPIDAATLLKPALARHQIQLIGTCTLEQYQQYIERNATLQRRFQEIVLPVL